MFGFLQLKPISFCHKNSLQFIKLYNIYFFSVFIKLNLQNLSFFNSVFFIILRVLRVFGLVKSINKSDFY